MTMIQEDYANYKIAKLLKEKGFPQEYDKFNALVYNEEDYEREEEVQRMQVQTIMIKEGTLHSYPAGVPEPKCYCPTIAMVMKWLRKAHNLIITIDYDKYEMPFNKHKVGYGYGIQQTTTPTEFLKIGENVYSSYEEACEYAIIDCLTNLI